MTGFIPILSGAYWLLLVNHSLRYKFRLLHPAPALAICHPEGSPVRGSGTEHHPEPQAPSSGAAFDGAGVLGSCCSVTGECQSGGI